MLQLQEVGERKSPAATTWAAEFLLRAGESREFLGLWINSGAFHEDDDVFYVFLQKQKIGAELHIYLEEGTCHKRLFRGPNTNDMKK
jgi:hypothetical protein